MAGNVTEASQSIELIATFENLQETIARLCAEDYITKNDTYNELSSKLDAALYAYSCENNKTAVSILNAFQCTL